MTSRSNADRPPAYLSINSLAREIDASPSTVRELVRQGVLPQPLKLSSGCVRFRWADVELALDSLSASKPQSDSDQFLAGVRNVTPAA